MSGAVTILPLYAFMAWRATTLPFTSTRSMLLLRKQNPSRKKCSIIVIRHEVHEEIFSDAKYDVEFQLYESLHNPSHVMTEIETIFLKRRCF
jgi:hypothetical protein